MCDLPLEEQLRWEEEELDKPVSLDNVRLDPAPFQLVEKSSLLKVTPRLSFASCQSGHSMPFFVCHVDKIKAGAVVQW